MKALATKQIITAKCLFSQYYIVNLENIFWSLAHKKDHISLKKTAKYYCKLFIYYGNILLHLIIDFNFMRA